MSALHLFQQLLKCVMTIGLARYFTTYLSKSATQHACIYVRSRVENSGVHFARRGNFTHLSSVTGSLKLLCGLQLQRSNYRLIYNGQLSGDGKCRSVQSTGKFREAPPASTQKRLEVLTVSQMLTPQPGWRLRRPCRIIWTRSIIVILHVLHEYHLFRFALVASTPVRTKTDFLLSRLNSN